MAELITMPKMSDTMTEGVIAAWHKKVGDTVKSGEVLAEVETDKATMELESYQNGTLLYIGPKEKESVPVDGLIAIIGKPGEDVSALISGQSGGAQPAAPVAEVAAVAAPSIDVSNIKAEIVSMPKMSDTMTEGVVVAWHKKVGDKVKSGELMAEIETDKATMEFECYTAGTVLYLGVEAGKSIPVNGVLAVIGEAGADYKALLAAQGSATSTPESPKESSAPVASSPAPAAVSSASSSSSSDDRLKVSPLAKKMAQEKGISLTQVKGSGTNGRIVKSDVESFTPSTSSNGSASKSSVSLPQVVGQVSFDEVPVSQMRKTIAKRLSESKNGAPHFYLTMEINMDKAIQARKSINEVADTKVSFNDMVIKAVAASLRKHPAVNSSWLGDKIRYNHHINIGVAVAIEDGLLVPVIRFADSKTLTHIGAEVKDLATRAKNRQLQPADWEGSTFTISNLGMFGIDEFTAIINPPDACILAVGGIKETPVVKNGQVVPGNIMKVTLSCDHRVVDGAVGSAFLQTLKQYLEDPVRILA